MCAQRQEAEQLVEEIRVTKAAESTMQRFGARELEAERRARVRGMVRGSRSLIRALSQFVDCATAHADGVHCSAKMDAETTALNEALVDFVFATREAATCCGASNAADTDVSLPLTRRTLDEEAARHASWLPLRWPSPPGVESLPPIVHRDAMPHPDAAPATPSG